jgi:hypothetical protein
VFVHAVEVKVGGRVKPPMLLQEEGKKVHVDTSPDKANQQASNGFGCEKATEFTQAQYP